MSRTVRKNFAFHDVPPGSFPLTIEFIAEQTGAVVHTIEVPGPGAVDIPSLIRYGPVAARITLANGDIHTGGSDGSCTPIRS